MSSFFLGIARGWCWLLVQDNVGPAHFPGHLPGGAAVRTPADKVSYGQTRLLQRWQRVHEDQIDTNDSVW
jgi:hypothetical protein